MTTLLVSGTGIAGLVMNLLRIGGELRVLRAQARLAALARELPPDSVLQITQRDGAVWFIKIPPLGSCGPVAQGGLS